MNFVDRINEKNEAAKYNKNDEEVFTFSELDEAVIKVNAIFALTCVSGVLPGNMRIPVKDISAATIIMGEYVNLLKKVLKGDL